MRSFENMYRPYGIVYKTTNLVNNKVYIGQSVNIKDNSYMGSGVLIKSAIKKYGKHNFKKEIIGYCKDRADLSEAEKVCIEFFDSRNPIYGYNLSIGGESVHVGCKHSEETKERMSIAHKNMSEETKRKISIARKGKKASEETRRKLSESHKKVKDEKILIKAEPRKRQLSEETKRKIGDANRGRTHTKETREKLRQTHLGYKMPEEQKNNISKALKGKPNHMKGKKVSEASLEKRKGQVFSEKRKKDISERMKGRVVSEETRKKISMSLMGHPYHKRKNNTAKTI